MRTASIARQTTSSTVSGIDVATIDRQQLNKILARAQGAGIDSSRVIKGLLARGHQVEGYHGEAPGAVPMEEQGTLGRDMLGDVGAAAGGGAAIGLGYAAAERLGPSRRIAALGAHTAERAIADKGPLGYFAGLNERMTQAARQPKGFGPLGSSVGMVPERTLPSIEPMQPPVSGALSPPPGTIRPPIPGNFGGQPPAGPPGLSLGPAPEPVPTRPITVEGAPARAPAPTTEPRYTGGRGASGPVLAKRAKDLAAVSRGESVTAAGPSAQPSAPSKLAAALEQSMQNEAVPRGTHPVSFGKNGNVIGAIGDEARVAGRAARSVEELGKLAAKIAAKVPRSARLAVFQTVKNASKFVGESDAALGGPAMAFMTRFFPTSTMQDIMNTHFTVDPKTGKIVKRHTDVGA